MNLNPCQRNRAYPVEASEPHLVAFEVVLAVIQLDLAARTLVTKQDDGDIRIGTPAALVAGLDADLQKG